MVQGCFGQYTCLWYNLNLIDMKIYMLPHKKRYEKVFDPLIFVIVSPLFPLFWLICVTHKITIMIFTATHVASLLKQCHDFYNHTGNNNNIFAEIKACQCKNPPACYLHGCFALCYVLYWLLPFHQHAFNQDKCYEIPPKWGSSWSMCKGMTFLYLHTELAFACIHIQSIII